MKQNKRESHEKLRNIYPKKDIYVLGSGSSMNFMDPEFFIDKITIGANSIYKFFPVNYSVIKHAEFIQPAVDANQTVISPKHDCGDIDKQLNENENIDYIYTHKRGRFGELENNFVENLESIGKDDDIFVSYSTITSAIHLAAYMGAKNIIVCGHDCGYIDGVSHLEGYAQHIKDFHKTDDKFNKYHNAWFDRIGQDTIRLKAKLKEVYNCNVCSINPFFNLRLEGHNFKKCKI